MRHFVGPNGKEVKIFNFKTLFKLDLNELNSKNT